LEIVFEARDREHSEAVTARLLKHYSVAAQ
jgi:hypothetical protein